MNARVVVLGAGGHAKVVIDAIQQANKQHHAYSIVGLVDDVTGVTEFCGYRVERNIHIFDASCFVVAIGDNRARRKKFDELLALNYEPLTIVHPAAILSPDIKVGSGSVIMAGAVINVATTIGVNCIINTAASIDHDCIIGDHCHVAPGCTLAGNVVVGEGSFLGLGTKIIPHLRIGTWAITGAGSVLIKDVADGQKVVGVPAHPL